MVILLLPRWTAFDNDSQLSNSRHVKRIVRFFRTALSCLLLAKAYETYLPQKLYRTR